MLIQSCVHIQSYLLNLWYVGSGLGRKHLGGKTQAPIVPVARQHQLIPESEKVPEKKQLSGKALELQMEREKMKERRRLAMLKSKKATTHANASSAIISPGNLSRYYQRSFSH